MALRPPSILRNDVVGSWQRSLHVLSSRHPRHASKKLACVPQIFWQVGAQSSSTSLSIRRFSAAASAVDTRTTTRSEEQVVRRRFEDLGLHPKSLKALQRHGLHKLTEIQEKSFDLVVQGKDVVGRARTGTGKTLSFLLPALERIVRQAESSSSSSSSSSSVQILILSPTRELAAQIGKEAERLVAQHGSEITSQVVFGGSSRREDIERFNNKLPTILVATPGRLKDHLASTKLNDNRSFVEAVQKLQVLVLDETDRLLDMGFRRDVTDILSCLPKKKRQTLLFSATIPQSVKEVVDLAIKPNYEMVDCIEDEDPTSHTNAQTEQSHIVLPTERFWTGSLDYLLDLADQRDNKVMVFFPMTSMVQMYARIFNTRFGRRVWELHSRMHQRERTTISGRFRNINKGILFTSDVSARGVDYPNVTHVVQIGASESRETYIHRLGRTGRAGKKGKGILILPEVEEDFLQDLEDLDLHHDIKLQNQLIDSGPSKKLRDELSPMSYDVKTGKDPKLERDVHDAYQAMIAYYFQRCGKYKEREVVGTVNQLVQDIGLRELPAIDLKRAKRIGLDGLPGLNIQMNWKDQNWTSDWTNSPPPPSRGRGYGKAYGDFEGRFGFEDERDRNSPRSKSQSRDWNNNDSRGRPAKSRPSRSDWGGDRDSRKHGRSESRKAPNRFNKAFQKVGWKKQLDEDFKGNSSPSRRGGNASFKRWEAPGSFSGRG